MPPALAAMLPMYVVSAVRTTTPMASPASTSDEQKAMLRASTGDGAAAKTPQATGSDSPVSEEKSKRSPLTLSKRRSAGTRAPATRWTTSPTTSCAAGSDRSAPPRTTRVSVGSMDRTEASSALASRWCTKVIVAVTCAGHKGRWWR